MRKVKTCLFCNFYNDYRYSTCKKCGASLHDVIIEEIETLAEYAEVKNNEEHVNDIVDKCHNDFVRICPFCFEENDSDNEICYICNSNISNIKPIKKNKVEEVNLEKPLSNEIVEEKTIISKRLILNNPDINLEFVLVDKLLIGRKDFLNLSADICKYISRDHLLIKELNGFVNIKDISTNGSLINGIRMEKNKFYTIKTGDQITVYNVTFNVII